MDLQILDVTLSGDVRVNKKELENIVKDKTLKEKMARMLSIKKMTLIPVVVSALVAIKKTQKEKKHLGYRKDFENVTKV